MTDRGERSRQEREHIERVKLQSKNEFFAGFGGFDVAAPQFPTNPRHGDTFRWFNNDGWYRRISESGLWERHGIREPHNYHFWLGAEA